MIPGIPEESNLAEGPAKLIKPFRRNVERNSNSAGMVPGFTRKELPPGTTGTESSTSKSIVGKCRRSIWASSAHQFFLPQPPPPPPSTTPTPTTVATSPPSPSSPPTAAVVYIRRPSTPQQQQRGNATSAGERAPATSIRWMQGATSLPATWQPLDDERQHLSSFVLIVHPILILSRLFF